MEVTYEWKITDMERRLNDDYVLTIHWVCSGTFNEHKSTYTDFTNFPPDYPSLVPFEEITEEIALKWVWSSTNKNEIETSIYDALYEKENPPVTNGLPWQ